MSRVAPESAWPAILREGDLIRFTFKRQSGNYRWYECVATGIYIGLAHNDTQVVISFRPEAGTSYFTRAHIMKVELLDSLEGRRDLNQLREDNRVKLPVQKKGAVPAP